MTTGDNNIDIITIGGMVMGLTEIAKRTGLPERFVAVAALLMSAIIMVVLAWSKNDIQQATSYLYLTAWINVLLVSMGIHGAVKAIKNAAAR